MRIFRRIMLGGVIDIDALPDTQKIYYKATSKVAPKRNSLGVSVIANKWDATTCEGIIVCASDIIKIGEDAFYNCSNLTSVTIPDSVTSIEYRAFAYCDSLTSVTIPDSVTTIGDKAFSWCESLTSVTIGDSVTTIKSSVFAVCKSLKGITIPNSVKSIGHDAFYNCTSLESIIIPESVTEIEDHTFNVCTSLENITIPNSVTEIGYGAFGNCTSLKSVTIPESITSIGDYAFSACSSLEYVYCKPTTPPTGNFGMFNSNSSGRKIYVPAGSVEAYRNAQYWSNYTSAIVGYDFEKGEIDISNAEIWYTSSDGKIINPYETTVFGANITSNTYTEGKGLITFDGDVTAIGNRAFNRCQTMKSVTIPNSVTTIGDWAFYGCSLTSVTIPDSVTTIEDEAFYGCNNLKEFNGKFASEDGRCLIIDGTLNSFAPYGLNEYTIPDSVTTIGSDAFYGESLKSIIIPDSVIEIKVGAFHNTQYLTSVTIGESVETIGNDAFAGCSRFTSITIPNSVKTIGDRAFTHCKSLTSVTIGEGVKTIGENAFFNCYSITSITIPNGVTSIGARAFYYCSSLTSITIPENVETIGDYAFGECFFTKESFINNSGLDEIANKYWGAGIYDIVQDDGLCISDNTVYDCKEIASSVTIPDSVTSIEEDAFRRCSSLTSITIPDGVTRIGERAFSSCSSLTSVYCKATTPPALGGTYVFDYNGSGRKIYVPTDSVSAYKSATNWSKYADAIEGYEF